MLRRFRFLVNRLPTRSRMTRRLTRIESLEDRRVLAVTPIAAIDPEQGVESIVQNVVATDFGDAPAAFPVTEAQNGARHTIGDLFLGLGVTAEVDGVPSDTASSDSNDDGVIPIADILFVNGVATTSSVEVTASEPGRLDAWVDFTGDGDWDDPGEQIATSVSVLAGSNTLSFVVPGDAVPGSRAARYRVSTIGQLSPTGAADDGEVEDYMELVIDSNTTPDLLVATVSSSTNISALNDTVTVADNSNSLFSAPVDQFGSLSVIGTISDDTFTLDVSGGFLATEYLLNGGGGDDLFRVVGGDAALDLTMGSMTLSEFGTIDLDTASGTNSLGLNLDAVIAVTPFGGMTRIVGGANDQIRLADAPDWRMGPTTVENNVFLRSIVHSGSGQEQVVVDLPRAWQNVIERTDVNNDGNVSASDALAVINELARTRFFDPNTNDLVDPLSLDQWPGSYYDSNGDDRLSPSDALAVINELARRVASGEGEAFDFLRSAHDENAISEFREFGPSKAVSTAEKLTSHGASPRETFDSSIGSGSAESDHESDDGTKAVDLLLADGGVLSNLVIGPTQL